MSYSCVNLIYSECSTPRQGFQVISEKPDVTRFEGFGVSEVSRVSQDWFDMLDAEAHAWRCFE